MHPVSELLTSNSSPASSRAAHHPLSTWQPKMATKVLFLILSHQKPTRDRIEILNTTHKVLHYLSPIYSFTFPQRPLFPTELNNFHVLG